MGKINCFTVFFMKDDILPSIRTGIRVQVDDDMAKLNFNGVASQELFIEPVDVGVAELFRMSDQDASVLFEKYRQEDPWIVKTTLGYKLLNAYITEDEQNIQANPPDSTRCYIMVHTEKDAKVFTPFGAIVSKVIDDYSQTTFVSLTEWGDLVIDTPKSSAIIGWNGENLTIFA